MAALAYVVSQTLHDLWSLSAAFVNNGGNLRKALHQLRVRDRDLLFRRYCRDLWLVERNAVNAAHVQALPGIDSTSAVIRDSDSVDKALRAPTNVKTNRSHHCANMKRAHIDFAAMEASAAAYDAIDIYAGEEVLSRTSDATTGISAAGVEDFMQLERQHYDWQESLDDIEVIDGVEVDTSFYDYLDRLPLYEDDHVPQLHEGVSYIITGCVLPDCERFSINFMLPEGDVALHINPRLPQNYIVRNTKVKDVWGKEEVSSPLPFTLHRGGKFSVQVLVTHECYMISVNGQHFAEYSHRLPYKLINTIQVKGDVEQVAVERRDVREYPERLAHTRPNAVQLDSEVRNSQLSSGGGGRHAGAGDAADEANAHKDELDGMNVPHDFRFVRLQSVRPNSLQDSGYTMPFYGQLPAASLYTGRCIKIEGRIKLLPHSFYINLQQGQNIWPHPLVAFHFNPRFAKQSGALGTAIVCRNAWHNGAWGREERSELDTDLRPGKMFSLAIVCVADAFEVYVNRKYVTEFKYQLQPDVVDMVYIQGDIKLWKVLLENNTLLDGTKKRIYQNPAYVDEY